MPYRRIAVAFAVAVVCLPAVAQDTWAWSHKIELRGNYRWSEDARFNRPFPPGAAETTADPGSHVELNVADLQLDLTYGSLFAARAKVHAQAKHRRNPTSTDRNVDADELWVRIGPKPEFLERPEGTTFFAQAGKFPKMERQPVRLLESYGLAATSFNRFEDLQLLIGGTVGRNFYWRAQAANGNPLFMRDPNALAGDNGTSAELSGGTPKYGTGFPILYNAETEDLFFDTEHLQLGEAVGYRWQREDETLGFDVIAFHYERELADTVDLSGTIYGGDLDLLTITREEVPSVPGGRVSLGPTGDTKREYGARLYSEWHNATAIAQFTKQNVGGLQREGWEIETGYRFPVRWAFIDGIQPALRASGLKNRFVGSPAFPAASVRWQWEKYDAGIRIGLPRGLDVTLEYSYHNIKERPELNLRETLVTLRYRV